MAPGLFMHTFMGKAHAPLVPPHTGPSQGSCSPICPNLLAAPQKGRAMTSGFEMASMILTSCQTKPVHVLPYVAECFALMLSQHKPDQH